MDKSSAVADMGDLLATIDIGRKVGADVPLSVGVELGPHLRQCLYIRIVRTKWHVDLSSCLATTHMGRKLGTVAPLGELGPHLTQCGLGRGLLLYQVAS